MTRGERGRTGQPPLRKPEHRIVAQIRMDAGNAVTCLAQTHDCRTLVFNYGSKNPIIRIDFSSPQGIDTRNLARLMQQFRILMLLPYQPR